MRKMSTGSSGVPCWTALSCHSWIPARRCVLQLDWSPQSWWLWWPDGHRWSSPLHKDTNGYCKSSLLHRCCTLKAQYKASDTEIQILLPQLWITYRYRLHILWKFHIYILPGGIWLVLESSLDFSPMLITHTDCVLLKYHEGTHTHSPACCPWMMLSVPSGAPASWSILARSMVHPGTRSEGFIR